MAHPTHHTFCSTVMNGIACSIRLQIPLFLSIPAHPPRPLNQQPLPPPHAIHIPLGDILAIPKLAQILQLDLRTRNPPRIHLIQHLEAAGENQHRHREPRRTLADLVAEAEGFGDGEGGLDGEVGGPFEEGFGQDGAAAAGEDAVDAAEDGGGGLDGAAVEGEEDARGPVEEGGGEGVEGGGYEFACLAGAVGSGEEGGGGGGGRGFWRGVVVVVVVEGDGFEEDGYALHGFSAEGPLVGG